MRKARKGFFFRFIRFFLWAIPLVLVLGLLVGGLSLAAWLRGNEFRTILERTLRAPLAAEVTLDDLEWNAGFNGLSAMKLGARGDGLLQKALCRELMVKFDPTALFSRTLRLGSIDIRHADLVLGTPTEPSATSKSVSPSNPGPPWLASLTPTRTELGPIKVSNLDLQWDFSGNKGGLADGSVVAKRFPASWELNFSGGRLRLPGLPDLRVVETRLACSKSGVRIERSELAPVAGPGGLRFSGDLTPTPRIEGEIAGVRVADLVDSSASAHFEGLVSGKLSLGPAGSATEARGNLVFDQARLRLGSAMDRVASLTGRPDFTDMPLHVAEMSFAEKQGRLVIERLVIESRGLLAAEGSFAIANGQIDGAMWLGLPPAILRRFPGASTAVFQREERGYKWTEVRVSGPLNNPNNDLVTRLLLAPLNGTVLGLTSGLHNGVSGALGLSLGIVETAVGTTGKVLETTVDVVGGVGRTAAEVGGKALGVVEKVLPPVISDLLPFGEKARERREERRR